MPGRRVQDLTSITAFIERKWNLPAMTFRDANADPMIDYFDFVVHVFSPETRAFYGLERLWGNAEQIEVG